MQEVKTLIRTFDTNHYLNSKGIPVLSEGKNLSSGWVGVPCPWCWDDPSYHLGINLNSNGISCWRCGTTGTILKLVCKIERCGTSKALGILTKFSDPVRARERLKPTLTSDITTRNLALNLQFDLENNPLEVHKQFLEKRGFDPLEVHLKYKLKYTGPVGYWRFRIIIPVFMNGKMVSVVGRDVTECDEVKYRVPNDNEVIVPKRHLVYGLEREMHTALIVEGPFDRWTIGKGALCFLTSNYTPGQIKTILQYSPNIIRAFTLFDSEPHAQKKAKELGHIMTSFIPEVHNIALDSGDPNEMSPDDVKHLRKEVFGSIY